VVPTAVRDATLKASVQRSTITRRKACTAASCAWRCRPKDNLAWLTRSEAAKLRWVCWRAREVRTVHRGPCKGQKTETDKRPLRHLALHSVRALYQAGVDMWEAASFLGMSVEMLVRMYGHHHLAHLRTAAHTIGYPRAAIIANIIASCPTRGGRKPLKKLVADAVDIEPVF
jgi:hypothetical protein